MEYATWTQRSAFDGLNVLVIKTVHSRTFPSSTPLRQWKQGFVVTASSVERAKDILQSLSIDVVIYEAEAARLDALIDPGHMHAVRDGNAAPPPVFLCITDETDASFDRSAYVACSAGVGAYVLPRDAVEELLEMLRYLDKCKRTTPFHTGGALVAHIEEHVNTALASGHGLRLVLLPQFDLDTGRMVGADATLRWRHPQWGDMPSRLLMAIALKLRLDVLHFYLIEKLAVQVLRDATQSDTAITITVPVYTHILCDPGLSERLMQRLEQENVGAHNVKLELNERFGTADLDDLSIAVRTLQKQGLQVVLRDMPGDPSIRDILSKLPVSELALDMTSMADQWVCTLEQAHAQGMRVVAKRIATPIDADALRTMGCSAGEGITLGGAMETAAFVRAIRRASSQSLKSIAP